MASSPQVTIFSDPAKSQDQALSYLLTGRSLENSGEQALAVLWVRHYLA